MASHVKPKMTHTCANNWQENPSCVAKRKRTHVLVDQRNNQVMRLGQVSIGLLEKANISAQ